MSEISAALAKEGIEAGVDAAKGFLSKLLGPATEEAGLILQDRVRLYRLRNQLRVLDRAQSMIRKAGLEPMEVPLRTLVPLLEGASLEDNESLSDKWAGLLANAATMSNKVGLHPSYPRILQELSPVDALVLDRLQEVGGKANWKEFRAQMMLELSLSQQELDRIHNNLFRLALSWTTNTSFEISKFGKDFLRGCSGPSASGI